MASRSVIRLESIYQVRIEFLENRFYELVLCKVRRRTGYPGIVEVGTLRQPSSHRQGDAFKRHLSILDRPHSEQKHTHLLVYQPVNEPPSVNFHMPYLVLHRPTRCEYLSIVVAESSVQIQEDYDATLRRFHRFSIRFSFHTSPLRPTDHGIGNVSSTPRNACMHEHVPRSDEARTRRPRSPGSSPNARIGSPANGAAQRDAHVRRDALDADTLATVGLQAQAERRPEADPATQPVGAAPTVVEGEAGVRCHHRVACAQAVAQLGVKTPGRRGGNGTVAGQLACVRQRPEPRHPTGRGSPRRVHIERQTPPRSPRVHA